MLLLIDSRCTGGRAMRIAPLRWLQQPRAKVPGCSDRFTPQLCEPSFADGFDGMVPPMPEVGWPRSWMKKRGGEIGASSIVVTRHMSLRIRTRLAAVMVRDDRTRVIAARPAVP